MAAKAFNMKIETKGFVLAAVTSASVLALSFGLVSILRTSAGTTWTVQTQSDKQPLMRSSLENQAKRGHELFDRNCSHCHGDDARGDEGPSLYDLTLSDGRISKRI